MVLSDEDIINFQTLYKSEFGIEIGKEDAYEKGIKLLRLMFIVYKPMTQEEFDLIQKHRSETLPLLINKINKNETK
jgi:hypothetical protein